MKDNNKPINGTIYTGHTGRRKYPTKQKPTPTNTRLIAQLLKLTTNELFSCYKFMSITITLAAVAQWLMWRACTQHAWFQLQLVPIWVTGVSRKGILPKLLLCDSNSPTLVPQCLGRHGQALEQGSQVNDIKQGRTIILTITCKLQFTDLLNWSPLFHMDSCQNTVLYFYSVILSLLEHYLPIVSRYTFTNPGWPPNFDNLLNAGNVHFSWHNRPCIVNAETKSNA